MDNLMCRCSLHSCSRKEKEWEDAEILITGGTGSLGKAIVKKLLLLNPHGIRIYSRDEFKQYQMAKELKDYDHISYLLGDVRDLKRLELATKGVDIIIHAAAMKHISKCEDNPIEAIKTNIQGSENVIMASLNNGVKTVMNISTDKAVYPVNFYGVTKALSEKLFVHSNIYGAGRTKFACCRYGNVLGSRGSIIPLFKEQAKTGILTITDKDMTRFWITLEEIADFVIGKIKNCKGGEIFIPKMPSMKIVDLAQVVAPMSSIKEVGIREGEKLHECLITVEESVHAKIFQNHYEIIRDYFNPIPFSYTSQNNPCWLTAGQLKEKLNANND